MHPSFVLLLLLHIAVSTISTSTVHNVIPDEATSTDTCESCKTLGQYLKNKKRYFTSNSKFYFRPGRYSISYDLILYNIPNVSLIGSSPNNTIIKCKNYQFRAKLPITIEFHSPCFFQYYQFENKIGTSMYTIAIQNSNNNNIFDFNTGNINCKLTEGSLYYGMNPLTVHQQHFQLINKTGRYPLFNTGLLCYCLDKVQSNCLTNTIGPFFPGETFESC